MIWVTLLTWYYNKLFQKRCFADIQAISKFYISNKADMNQYAVETR